MARSSGRASMTDMARQIGHTHKVVGFIIAIAMVVLGILFLIWPVVTGYTIMVIATIGFIIYGVWQIIAYIRTPHDLKNGWVLANGIIFLVLGFLLLAESRQEMYMSYAFLLGFLAMYSGIMQIASFAGFHRAGEPGAAWILISGIINIILSICLLTTPFIATWALEYVLGIYLIVAGVALFAEAASGRYAMKM